MNDQLLTVAELAALEAEVQKEIDKETKAKAKEQTKKEMLQRARVARGLAEPHEQIMINLPESADKILVNQFAYQQGMTYTVPASVAIMLRATMQGAWEHQAQIEGRAKDHFRKQRLTHVGAAGGVANAPFLRV